MTAIFERRNSAAAQWAQALALFAACLAVISVVSHRFGLVDSPTFFWALGLVVAFALCAVVLACVGLSQVWRNGDRGGRASLAGLALGLLLLVPVVFVGVLAFTLPRLNDVTTDTAEPPRFHATEAAVLHERYPAIFVAAQRSTYPLVTGRRYALPAVQVAEIIDVLLAARSWQPVAEAPDGLSMGEVTIEAVARSPILGLLSDIAIRITDEGETTYVDMRSASRIGAHDLGDNARKVTTFLAQLDAEVTARATLELQPAE